MDSSFLPSFVISSSLPSLKPTTVGLLVVPPGLSLNLFGLLFGSQLAVSGSSPWLHALFLGVACTWMSLGSLAWWLRSSVLGSGLVTLPSLIMVGLVPALCVPGSVLASSCCFCRGRPLCSSWSQNAGASYRSCSTQCSGRLEGLGLEKYSECGRHQVQSLPVSDQDFLSLDVETTRCWILSSLVAATVGLGATFSPGTYSRFRSSSRSSACPWGCGNGGCWEHITWECPYHLGPFPPKPTCPYLARFGWAQKISCPNEVLRFDAGWLSAKTPSGTLRNLETRSFFVQHLLWDGARFKVFFFVFFFFLHIFYFERGVVWLESHWLCFKCIDIVDSTL